MGNAMTVFRQELSAMETQFDRVLPQTLPAQRLTRTIESAVVADPKLLDVNRASLWKACMTAATFGLEVDGRQAAVVRFKNQAQLIPMYQGLITLAFNAGYIIDATVVRAKDDFTYAKGDGAMIHHQPRFGGGTGNENAVVGAYAMAWPKGFKQDRIFEVLDLQEIHAIRDRAPGVKSGRSTPWNTDFPAMARKTAIRKLATLLPWKAENLDLMKHAVTMEERHEVEDAITSADKAEDGSVVIDAEVITDES